jgi:hypothetical protein
MTRKSRTALALNIRPCSQIKAAFVVLSISFNSRLAGPMKDNASAEEPNSEFAITASTPVVQVLNVVNE